MRLLWHRGAELHSASLHAVTGPGRGSMVIRVSPTIELIAGHKKEKRAAEESRLRGELVLREKKRKGVISYSTVSALSTMVFHLVKVQGQSK